MSVTTSTLAPITSAHPYKSEQIPSVVSRAYAKPVHHTGPMRQRDTYQVIHLHPSAPTKPRFGAPCNGCGVCCAWAPCPLGRLLGATGPCAALQWHASSGSYRCGWVQNPMSVLPWLPAKASGWVSRLARRWISSGSGCDAALEAHSGPVD